MSAQIMSSDRLRSVPDWAWFAAASVVAVLVGALLEVLKQPYHPVVRGFVLAGVIVYLYPGWRLRAHVEKHWGRLAGTAVWFVWFLVLLPAALVSERFGY